MCGFSRFEFCFQFQSQYFHTCQTHVGRQEILPANQSQIQNWKFFYWNKVGWRKSPMSHPRLKSGFLLSQSKRRHKYLWSIIPTYKRKCKKQKCNFGRGNDYSLQKRFEISPIWPQSVSRCQHWWPWFSVVLYCIWHFLYSKSAHSDGITFKL